MKRTVSMTLIVLAVILAAGAWAPRQRGWSASEIEVIASLRLAALGPLPADPSNRVAEDTAAVALGQRLFFDTRLSSNGAVSCATCHDPAREFQDGTALARGVGTTDRRTMPLASTAWNDWFFWDGRTDSQWAQALGPLESAVEHGGTRAQYARVIATHYRDDYEAIFGALPDEDRIPATAGPHGDASSRGTWTAMEPAHRDSVTRVFVNVGKAIAAYERRLQYGPSRFDRWADNLVASGRAHDSILTRDEVEGLRLFVGKAQCINCHNGPLFTDQHFHNTGVAARSGLPDDLGRTAGAPRVRNDEFNCTSPWSDAPREACTAIAFMVDEGAELERAFKTPSLRNAAERAPYMHAGQLDDLDEVVRHYDRAPKAPRGTSELRPLRLSARERAQLVAFLRSLSAPLATPRHLLEPPR